MAPEANVAMEQGFSPRVFVVVGTLTGLAGPVLIAVVFRKFGAPYGVAAIVLWGVLTIPVASCFGRCRGV